MTRYDKKILLKHLSPSTAALYNRLLESGQEVFTSGDMNRLAGADRRDITRMTRALRQAGLLQAKPGRQSKQWYFRLL